MKKKVLPIILTGLILLLSFLLLSLWLVFIYDMLLVDLLLLRPTICLGFLRDFLDQFSGAKRAVSISLQAKYPSYPTTTLSVVTVPQAGWTHIDIWRKWVTECQEWTISG